MICSSCGARCDPNRSFCPKCGSAVFLGETTPTRAQQTIAPAPVWKPSTSPVSTPSSYQVSSAGGASIWPLIRFVIFVAVVAYGIRALARVPEVDSFLVALRNTDAPTLTRVIDALRAWAGVSEPPPPSIAAPTPDRLPELERRLTQTPGETSAIVRRVYEQRDGVTAPRPVLRVRAPYTVGAVREKIEGKVTLKCTVEPDGTVSDVTVIRSLDSRFGLDDEAMKAVRQWRFTPGLREGRPVPAYAYVEITFSLRE